MSIGEVLIFICVLIGVIFNILGAIGLLRFPDVYTRLHAGTKTTTFGTIFICIAIMGYSVYRWLPESDSKYIILGVHTFVALLALLITNPTGAHAIARAAHRSGVKPNPAVVDALEEAKQ